MKVFISWSGPRSKAAAQALRQWLPDVIQSVKPWMSVEDIEAGARWGNEVTTELSETRFGIICLTKDNQTAPWILFEAGALSKTVEKTCVVPYLIDLSPSDILRGPLTQFQAKRANRSETWELVRTVNRSFDNVLTDEQLQRGFERCWPELEKVLESLPQTESIQEVKRSSEDMLSEILDLVREIARTPQSSPFFDTEDFLKKIFLDSNITPYGIDAIDKMLSLLTTKEERILRMHYGLGFRRHTLQEIANILDVSNHTVRTIELRALRRLRDLSKDINETTDDKNEYNEP